MKDQNYSNHPAKENPRQAQSHRLIVDIDSEEFLPNVNKEEKYTVMFPNGDYVAKNSSPNIIAGKPRYVRTNIQTIFNSAVQANEAARYFNNTGKKVFVYNN